MSYCISFPRRQMRKGFSLFICAVLFAAGLSSAHAKACNENAMLVFDASGSMGAMRNGMPKIITAVEAATDILPAVTQFRPTGLITYGGMRGAVCGDVHLKVPPTLNSGNLILAELGMIEPSGQTPLSDAVLLAAETLAGLGQPGIVVLITDGLENCGYDVCTLGLKLRTLAPNIRVHVIGFHMKSTHEQRIACLASATAGTYTSTHSLERLREALRQKLSCVKISNLNAPPRADNRQG